MKERILKALLVVGGVSAVLFAGGAAHIFGQKFR